MVNVVGFHRLDLVRLGKDQDGRRQYLLELLSDDNIRKIRACTLRALGLSILTNSL
jgi:hypothetical protein